MEFLADKFSDQALKRLMSDAHRRADKHVDVFIERKSQEAEPFQP
jgi:hypothetical protein